MPIERVFSGNTGPLVSPASAPASPRYTSLPLVRCACLALAALIVAQIFMLAAEPSLAHLLYHPWDKALHLAVYGVITALLWIATAGRMPLALFAMIICVATFDELNQLGIPGRSADPWDFVVDIAAAVGTAFILLLRGVAKPA